MLDICFNKESYVTTQDFRGSFRSGCRSVDCHSGITFIGGPALNRMEANGWTKTTVKPGEVITGIGYQFADGQKIVRLERVVLADGKEIRVYGR